MVSKARSFLSCFSVQSCNETGRAYVCCAGQVFLLGCQLLSGGEIMAGEDLLEQKNPTSLICHHTIPFGPSAQCRADSGIISCDVLQR